MKKKEKHYHAKGQILKEEKKCDQVNGKKTTNIGTVLTVLFEKIRTCHVGVIFDNKLKNKKKSNKKLVLNTNVILVFSIGLSSFFAFLGFLSMNDKIGIGNPSDFVIFMILSLVGPYSFYEYARLKRIDKLEKHLPNLLRDLAENGKSGMPLHRAIRTASHGKYGNLSPEIKRMAIQISWGASSTTALKDFARRVNTPLVNRSVNLIIEASNTGGNVADILTASANDTRKVQIMKEQRQIEMSTYTSVVYIAFFVFLAVVLVLTKSLIPAMEEAQSTEQESPSQEVSTGNIGIGGSALDVEKIKFIYLSAAIVQGLGDGLAAGVISDGRIVTGLRHSFIMVLIGFLLLRVM